MPTMKNERIPTNDNLQIPIVVSILVLSILGLAVRPPLLRKVIFATILFLSYFWLWKTQSDNLVKDYSLGLWVATNVFCLNDFVGLCAWDGDVQKAVARKRKSKKVTGRNGRGEHERKEEDGKEGLEEKEEIWIQPFASRLRWAFELWNAKRGVGWEHEAFLAPNEEKDILNARHKAVRAFINLYTAFFISATIHYLGDYAVLKDWTGGSMIFFMLQPVAITFEILVLRIVRATGIRVPRWLAKAAGYTWVLVWFTATLPTWVEPVVRAGFMEDGWHGPVVLWFAEKLRPAAAKWE
ncbi:hypothetical protein EST38_g9757 [Candolleomyces aberdarensis]|uniref:Wax synthase domain-containing protein n=1 Tax=Candolleomyces aberdarensis TaxID=2316362 RepID=A0A4Q2DBH5_9AGAR|nr:hypothetical protein EST38_g9757 [Candolleomyces aberdarensis]